MQTPGKPETAAKPDAPRPAAATPQRGTPPKAARLSLEKFARDWRRGVGVRK
jgi:hypothetical protein